VARVYYAADMLGVLPSARRAVRGIARQGTLPMQNPSPDELATFFAGYGVDRQKFIAALRGPAVDAKLAQARFLGNAGVDSTPSMVVASTWSAPRAVSTDAAHGGLAGRSRTAAAGKSAR
jgi:thiol:disulfide interchange protein DsbA